MVRTDPQAPDTGENTNNPRSRLIKWHHDLTVQEANDTLNWQSSPSSRRSNTSKWFHFATRKTCKRQVWEGCRIVPSGLVSQGCCNGKPPTGWLKTTEMSFSHRSRDDSPKCRCCRAILPCVFLDSGGRPALRVSLAACCSIPVSAPVVTWCSFHLCVPVTSTYTHTSHWN